MPSSCLLCDTIQLAENDQILILNSAADPFVPFVRERLQSGTITLAEDNVGVIAALARASSPYWQRVAFHDYMLRQPAETMDIAVMNLLYQPSNTWMHYGIQAAFYALKPGGRLYVVGAKDRGILSLAKLMQQQFYHMETLVISKGWRVLCSRKQATAEKIAIPTTPLSVFADNKLDEGTRLLLEALDVHATDNALDIGCGSGFIGLHIARLAHKGYVTMVDASLAAVAAAGQRIERSALPNIRVLPSDGVQAVLAQRFDLVVTNPPFHQGGIQTMEIAQRFIREAAQVLVPQGRFYLVANCFLKYEPTLQACFQKVEAVGGDTRYKVLRACGPGVKRGHTTATL